jgi:malonyl-CoA/methylmalonyl-CoA synthetase
LSHNIYELFRNRFADAYYEPFLSVPGEPSHSYADLDRRSAAMAAVLVEDGIQVGDRVVVQVYKSPDAIALYWACLRGGFIYVPLNTSYTAEEVGYFIGDAEPTGFVFSPSRAAKLHPVGDLSGVPHMYTLGTRGDGTLAEAATNSPGLSRIVRCGPQDVACILYTSGTTGRSKGAMLTHANLASNGRALHAIWRWREGDVLLHCLPIFHVHGLFVALHCAILNGSEVVFLPEFDVDAVRANLPSSTVVMGVPTYYSRLLADPDFGSADCESVRMFTCGSAPLPHSVFREFTLRTGHLICERYGMTECGIISSNPPEGQRVAGTVGYPLPEVEVRIVDDDGGRVGPNEIGTLEVRGPNVFAGYWQRPDKTAQEKARDGFFHTGDKGSMAPDGRLTLAGRTSDMIISGGYNVYPKEVEILLEEIRGVVETAVVGLPHPDFGEGVVAFVVADAGITEADLHDGIAHRLAKFKQPKSYIFVDDLPRNAMGKVQKSQLRSDYSETFALLDL